MSVSTFLAGFTATALFLLLNPGRTLTMFQMIAALSLTAALTLFIAAVYMYDRLSMPEGFWAGADRRGPLRSRGKVFEVEQKLNGDLYALMVWTWRWVFTPAVVIALMGFLAVVADFANLFLTVGTAAIVSAGRVYYWLVRPRLGTD